MKQFKLITQRDENQKHLIDMVAALSERVQEQQIEEAFIVWIDKTGEVKISHCFNNFNGLLGTMLSVLVKLAGSVLED